VSFVGTSSAAPVVSGIAGLAFSLAPQATPAEVERALESTAVPIPGVATGRVDAYAALHALAPDLARPAPAPAPGAGPAQPTGGNASTAGAARRTKVVRGRLYRGQTANVVLTSGAGRLQATVKLRHARRVTVRLRLMTAGRIAASAHGKGSATLRASLRARKYRLLVSVDSVKSLAYVLTISYP
jgi:subtilisin family serine protease